VVTAGNAASALERLDGDVRCMAEVVESQLDGALAALVRRDVVIADEVLRGDDEIDAWDVRIEHAGLEALATHKLAAADLRLVVASVRANTQLERIGDLATNLAERALALAKGPRLAQLDELARMGTRVQEMLKGAIVSFVTRDAALARTIDARDALVDELHRGLFASLEDTMRRSPEAVEAGIALLSCSRYLERIGDHAKNIAEDAIYLVEGTVVRHGRARVESSRVDAILVGQPRTRSTSAPSSTLVPPRSSAATAATS
jgi:phosphate transport system protein